MSAASSGAMRAEDLRDLLVRAILQELALVMVVELLEHVGLELAVVLADGLDDLLALAPGRSLHEVGDLGRMQLGELGVGDPQAHRRDVTHERLDAGPVEELARGDALPERPWAAGGAGRRAAPCRRRPRATSRRCSASSISFARTSRAPSTLISWRSSTSRLSSTSSGAALEVAQVELCLAQDHAVFRSPTRDRRPGRRYVPRPSPESR